MASLVVALMALLATGTTAATLTLASGDANLDALHAVLESSVNRVSGTLELRGSVIGRSEDGETLSRLQLPVRFFGEGPSVTFGDGDVDRPVIAFYTDTAYAPDISYTVEPLAGDVDSLLEPGETVLIAIDLTGHRLSAGERFTLEVSAPVGGTLIVQRRLPAILQPVMSLH